MTDDFNVKGSEALEKLGKVLKQAGNGKELRKELLRGFRAAGKPVVQDIKKDLGSKLPKRNGLAAGMAQAKPTVRNRMSAGQAGVRIDVRRKGHDLVKIDQGNLRHPIFGNRRRWVKQPIQAGIVTDAVERGKPKMQVAVVDAMEAVFNKIERSV